ncbi:GvpL/GvpF family gas vesicle protein [Pantanalinema rosaneae CENA516]|uniref:GvpL/GvpF family gas vesicle protein n=1 Tax=Pantanalinema rosaneae TaxID=1620701 RepID=UPI003D6EE9D6
MYLYALLPAPASELHLPEGLITQVQRLDAGKMVAVVEPEIALEPLEQDDRQLLQAILTHDRVVRELFAQTTVLPFRFGTCFTSSTNLLEHLTAMATDYLTTLQQLEGKAELTLKLTRLEPPTLEVSPDLKGKDYFLAKKQQYQQQQAFQQQQMQELEQITTAIGQVAANISFQPNHTANESLYILLARPAIAELQQSVSQWQQQYPLWQFSLSEALPPYHFVEQFLSPKSAETR